MSDHWPFSTPKLPDFEHRLPFIWRQFVDHCDAPLTVWAQALGPAIVHALIAWYYIDLKQVLRTMWKPPVYGWRARARGHAAVVEEEKKKSWRSKLGKIVGFDVSDYTGHLLNPFEGEVMVELLPGELFFWTALEPILVAAFYWSILDVGSGFFYEWTSAVAKTEFCHARDDAVLYAQAPGWVEQGIFGWDAIGLLDALKQRNIEFFNGFGVEQAVGPGVISVYFDWEAIDIFQPTPWIAYRLRCLTGPRTGTYQEKRVDCHFGDTGTAAATYDIQTGETWIGEMLVNGSFQIKNPSLFVQCNGFRPP